MTRFVNKTLKNNLSISYDLIRYDPYAGPGNSAPFPEAVRIHVDPKEMFSARGTRNDILKHNYRPSEAFDYAKRYLDLVEQALNKSQALPEKWKIHQSKDASLDEMDLYILPPTEKSQTQFTGAIENKIWQALEHAHEVAQQEIGEPELHTLRGVAVSGTGGPQREVQRG